MQEPGGVEAFQFQTSVGGEPVRAFVPPPHTAVPDCMTAFERFLHARQVWLIEPKGLTLIGDNV